MKRFIGICFAIILTVLFSLFAGATDVYIDGTKVEFTESSGYPFVNSEGSPLVPLRATMEALGAQVIQDNPNGTVIIRKGTTTVEVNTDENAIYRNGTKIPSPLGLVWQGGPLYVPVTIFEAFDAEVFTSGNTITVNQNGKNSSEVEVYAASYDESYRGTRFFDAKYEPKNGIYPGVQYGTGAGGNTAGYLVFANTNNPIVPHDALLSDAAKNGKLIQYALQINDLSEITRESTQYIHIASELEKSGAKIFFRLDFSTEENIDCKVLAEKFRIVSDIFRTYAPSVALIWEVPVGASDKEFLAAYPGDRYLDYVGVSVDFADGDSYTSDLECAVALFGYKKPIIVTEANFLGTSYSESSGIFKQLLDFYTYLPIRYPQVKAVFQREMPSDENGNTYCTGEYASILEAGTASASYLEVPTKGAENLPYFFELGSNVTVPPSKIRLYSHVGATKNDISHITYLVNGEQAGDVSPYTIPYEVTVDFSGFAGQTVLLEICAFDSTEKLFASKTYKIKVSNVQSADNHITAGALPITNVVAAIGIALLGVLAVWIIVRRIWWIFCR